MYLILRYTNLLYLILCIIWLPLQVYYLHVDGAGRTLLLGSLFVLFANFPYFSQVNSIYRSRAFLCWAIIIFFSMINTLVKGYVSEWGSLAFYQTNYIVPFTFLLILNLELDRDFDNCLKVIFSALCLYVFIGLLNFSGDDTGRFEAEELGNLLPLNAVCLIFVSCLRYIHQRISLFTIIIIFGLCLMIIILSGTRKALGASVILLLGFLITTTGEKKSLPYIHLIIFASLLYLGLTFIMENTVIGERLLTGSEQSDVTVSENKVLNWIVKTMLGDRATQYQLALLILPMSPITGIGIMNFMKVSGFHQRLHSEYMVQLCENGIIGFSLLLLFYYWLFNALMRQKKLHGISITMPFFGLLAILFLNFTAWSYCTTFGMIFYGIILSYAYTDNPFICGIEDEEDSSEAEPLEKNFIL